MGLCEQCVHFSTKDSEEYVTYCARCRDRNKFVRRIDSSPNSNAAAAVDALRSRQGGYQPFVSPKQSQAPGVQSLGSGQDMNNGQPFNAQINAGLQNPGGYQMPWQSMLQTGVPTFGNNGPVQNGAAPSFGALKNVNHILGTSPDSKAEDLTLRDKFALVALQNPGLNIAFTSPSDIAAICYAIADALLQARGK